MMEPSAVISLYILGLFISATAARVHWIVNCKEGGRYYDMDSMEKEDAVILLLCIVVFWPFAIVGSFGYGVWVLFRITVINSWDRMCDRIARQLEEKV